MIMSSSARAAPYAKEEMATLLHLKAQGYTVLEMSEALNCSYGSVVYKLSNLRKKGLIP